MVGILFKHIVHPPYDYQSLDEVCLESLSTRRQTLRYRFISRLLNGQINAPRLLERPLKQLSFWGTFYIDSDRRQVNLTLLQTPPP